MAKVLSRKVTIYVDGREVESTLRSLQAELNKLRNKQRTATIGSEEYVKTSLKMKEIESVLKEQTRAIQEAGQDWKEAREAASNYADILVGMKTLWGKGQDILGWAKGYVEEEAKMDDAYADVMNTAEADSQAVLGSMMQALRNALVDHLIAWAQEAGTE